MKKQREVNIELLRLIAMGMIILIHFMTHGLKLNIGFPTDTASMGVVISVYGILCICVNLFVLISGYFGIRITWKSFFKLWFTIYFYNILSSQLGVYLQQENFSFDFNCLRDFFALEKGWWFIYAYLGLMFFSPILNKAFDNFSKKETLISVALLSILEFYFGYVKQVAVIGFNAYSMLHLIYIYCLGRTIRVFSEELNQYRSKIKYLILVSYFAVLVCSILDYRVGTFDYLAYKYHHPFVVLLSCSVFVWFKHLNINSESRFSRFLLWASPSTLAIYLIHDNTITRPLIAQFISSHFEGFFSINTILFWTTAWMTIFFGSILFDRVRIFLLNRIIK